MPHSNTTYVKSPRYSQVELLVPVGVQLLGNGARALLHLADLNSDVRVGGAALILGDQALGADH